MAFTYDLTTNLGKLRLLIPDNVSTDYIFSDADLNAYLVLTNDDLILAQIQVYYSLAGKYNVASGDDVQIDNIRIKENTQKGAKFLELAKKLEEAYLSGSTLSLTPLFLAPGVYQSDITNNTDDQIDEIIPVKAFNKDSFSSTEYSDDDYLE